jgi:hypothetical protein
VTVTFEEELREEGLDPEKWGQLSPDDPIFGSPHFVFRNDLERSTPDTAEEHPEREERDC